MVVWLRRKTQVHELSTMARTLALRPGIGPTFSVGFRSERKNLGTAGGRAEIKLKLGVDWERSGVVLESEPLSSCPVVVRLGFRLMSFSVEGVMRSLEELWTGALRSRTVRFALVSGMSVSLRDGCWEEDVCYETQRYNLYKGSKMLCLKGPHCVPSP
jgi:hypothetical protein